MSQTQHTSTATPTATPPATPTAAPPTGGPGATGAGGDRVAQFKADVAAMNLRDPRASRERYLAFAGGVLLVVGLLLGVLAYFMSTGARPAFNTEGPAEQRDAMIVAIIGLTVAVVGAALFLRYSIGQFLRFWLARLIYEQHAQTDRIVGARDQ